MLEALPTGGAGTPPAPSYSFAADSGVRVPGGVGPVELVVGTTTYMFLGGNVAPNGKVLSSTDGLTFTPIAVTLDDGNLGHEQPLAGGAQFRLLA